jgi:hypothetical protein
MEKNRGRQGLQIGRLCHIREVTVGWKIVTQSTSGSISSWFNATEFGDVIIVFKVYLMCWCTGTGAKKVR